MEKFIWPQQKHLQMILGPEFPEGNQKDPGMTVDLICHQHMKPIAVVPTELVPGTNDWWYWSHFWSVFTDRGTSGVTYNMPSPFDLLGMFVQLCISRHCSVQYWILFIWLNVKTIVMMAVARTPTESGHHQSKFHFSCLQAEGFLPFIKPPFLCLYHPWCPSDSLCYSSTLLWLNWTLSFSKNSLIIITGVISWVFRQPWLFTWLWLLWTTHLP